MPPESLTGTVTGGVAVEEPLDNVTPDRVQNYRTPEKTQQKGKHQMRTPMFRLSYPAIFEQETNPDGQPTGKHSIVMVFDEEAQQTAEFKAMTAAIQVALKEKFGKKAKTVFQNMPYKPIRPIKEEEEETFGEGAVRVKASTKRRPRVISAAGGKEIFDASELYPGCYCVAEVEAFAYDKVQKGASFGLRGLIKIKDGEPIGNVAAPPEEQFSDLIDSNDNDGSEDLDDPEDWG